MVACHEVLHPVQAIERRLNSGGIAKGEITDMPDRIIGSDHRVPVADQRLVVLADIVERSPRQL